MEINKFQIYYKPNDSIIESFTIKYSRINKETNSYKYKLIKEIHNGNKIETYKIKEYRNDVNDILNKLEKINIDNIKNESFYYDNNELFCICLDDKKIITTKKENIQYILDLFNFDKLFNLDIKEYKKVS